MNSVLDYFNRKDKPSLLLLNPSSEPLASLGAAYNVSSTLRFSGISELSFTYPMSIDNGKTNTPGYDSIQNKMIVELEGVGKYIISESPESSDGSTPVKNIIAQSFESELLYKRIVGLSGTSIPFIDIPLSPASIMGKVAKLAPSWDIGEVDEELYDMYRSFDVGNNTIYNFLTSDVAKAFGCVFTFNTFLKTISAKLIKNLEDHTGGFISLDNVGRSIAVNEYSDELCTALTCYGGTDLDIRRVNPLGTNTIYNFDYYINNNSNNQWMSQGLKDKLKDWKTNLRNNEQLYRDITLENNMTIEEYTSISQLIVEYQSTLDSLQVTLEGLRAIPTKTEDEEARAARLAEIDKTLIDIANTQIAIRKARRDKSLKRQEIDNNNARLRVITNGLKFSGEYSWQSLSDFMVSFISNFSNIASDWKSIIFETADNLEVDVPQFSESVPSIEDAIYYISSDLEALYIDISENLRKYWYLTDNDRQRTIAHISNTNEKIINLCYMFDNLISNTDMAINLRSEAKELWSYGDIIDDTYENSSYLTREQYEELQYFIFDNTYTNNNIITTDIMTEEEVQEQALALYDQSVDVLSRASNPRYEISGDFISILNTPEFSDLVDKVDLGKQVTVELPNGNNHVDVTLLEMAYNYDSPDSFTMTFSNRVKLNNSNFKFADMFLGLAGGDNTGLSGITNGSESKSGAISTSQSLTGTNLLSVTNALISKLGFVSFGPTPPEKYGNFVGAWIGYDKGAKLSLYSSATDYLQWTGDKLLIKAKNFTLDSNGNITANNADLAGKITAASGDIGGWIIGEHTLYSEGGGLVLDSRYPRFTLGNSVSGSMVGEGVFIGNAEDSYVFRVGNPNGDYFAWDENGIDIAGDWIAGWTIRPNSLSNGVGDNRVTISSIGGDTPSFSAGGDPSSSAEFRVYNDGRLYAANAEISGSITATSGSIGGWVVTSNCIVDSSGNVGLISKQSEGVGIDDVRFWAGGTNPETALFKIYESGKIVATNADISGSVVANVIDATSGSIANWVISTNSLYSGSDNSYVEINSASGVPAIIAGGETVETAKFVVNKDGSISAKAGDIAGWAITSSSLVSPSNMAGITDGDFAFYAGNSSPASSNFYVKTDGTLLATSASITGSIIAQGGSIAGWAITSSSLVAPSGTAGITNGTYAFYAGNSNPEDAYFSVTTDGLIKAASGSIGGWEITNTSIRKNDIELNSVDEAIYVGESGSKIIIDGPNSQLRSENYASGTSGFSITGKSGDAEFNNIVARGEIRASVFSYDEVTATAGTFGVFKSAGILRDNVTTVSGANFTISIEDPEYWHARLFNVGDILRMKYVSPGGILDNWLKVESYADNGTYFSYTCSLQNGTPGMFTVGQSVIDYGVPGDGYLIMSSGSGVNGPHYTVNTSGSEPWNGDITQHVRMGNLNGFLDYGSDKYGIAIGNDAKGYMAYDPEGGLRIKGQVIITGQDGNEITRNPLTIYSNIMPKNPEMGDYWVKSGSMMQFYNTSVFWNPLDEVEVTWGAEPLSPNEGDFWLATEDWYIRSGGEWVEIPVDKRYTEAPTSESGMEDIVPANSYLSVPSSSSISIASTTLGWEYQGSVGTGVGDPIENYDFWISTGSSVVQKKEGDVWSTIWDITPILYNSGSRVYFSSIAPTETDLLTGDMWINPTKYGTVAENTLHRYNEFSVMDINWEPLINGEFASLYTDFANISGSISNMQENVNTRAQTFVQDGEPYENLTVYISDSAPSAPADNDVWYNTSGSEIWKYTNSGSLMQNISPEEYYKMQTDKVGDIWYSTSGGSNIYVYTAVADSGVVPSYPPSVIPDKIVYSFSDIGLSGTLMDEIASKATIYYADSYENLPTTANENDLAYASGLLYIYSTDISDWVPASLDYLSGNALDDLQAQVDIFSSDNVITGTEKLQTLLLYNSFEAEGAVGQANIRSEFENKLDILDAIENSGTTIDNIVSSASVILNDYIVAYTEFTTSNTIYITSSETPLKISEILVATGNTEFQSIINGDAYNGKEAWNELWANYYDARANLTNTFYTMTALLSTWDAIDGIPQPLNPPTVTGLYLTSEFLGYYNADMTAGNEWLARLTNEGNFHLGGSDMQYASLDWSMTQTGDNSIAQTGSLIIANADIEIYDSAAKVINISSENKSIALSSNVATMSSNTGDGIWMGKIAGTSSYGFRFGNDDKNITWSGDLLEINGGDIKLGTGGSPTLHISPGDLVTPDIPDSARFPFIAMGNPIPASYDSSNAGIWMGRDPSTTYVPISASLVMVGDEITTACVLASGPEGSGSFLTSSAPRYNFRVGDMTGAHFGWSGSWITLKNAHEITIENGGTFVFKETEIIDFATGSALAVDKTGNNYTGSGIAILTNESGKIDSGWLPDVKTLSLDIIYWDDVVTSGSGKGYWTVPESLDGYKITSVNVAVKSPSNAALTCRLTNTTPVLSDITLSNNPVINANKLTSYAGDGSPGVAYPGRDILNGRDIWAFDVVTTSGTQAKGLQFIIVLEKP